MTGDGDALRRALELDVVQFLVGTTFAVGGALLWLIALLGQRARVLSWLGFLVFALGAMTIARCLEFSDLLFAGRDAWLRVNALAVMLAPLGLLGFVDALFVEGRHERTLRLLGVAHVLFAVVTVGLDLAGLVSLPVSHRFVYALLAVDVFVVVRQVRRAMRREAVGGRTLLTGLAAFVVIALPDVDASWVGFTTTHFGALVFFVSLVLVLVERADAQRHRLELLNVELQRRIDSHARVSREAFVSAT